MRVILWIAFAVLIIINGPISSRIGRLAGNGNGIISAELAWTESGKAIIATWSVAKYNDAPLLEQVRENTNWDFAFIVVYVLLIIVESKSFMMIEPGYLLNELLRMNILFALAAGLMDVIENGLILHNISTWREPAEYIPSAIPAVIKFILSGWCIVVWITAMISQLFHRKQAKKFTGPPESVALLNSVIYLKQETIQKRNRHMSFDILQYLTDKNNTIDNRVKDAILFTYGDNTPDPSEIANDRAISDLGFSDAEYERLTGRFNVIVEVQKPTAAPLVSTDVKALADVQACIDAVNDAIK